MLVLKLSGIQNIFLLFTCDNFSCILIFCKVKKYRKETNIYKLQTWKKVMNMFCFLVLNIRVVPINSNQ